MQCFGCKSSKAGLIITRMDYEKAKQALATIKRDKQAQQNRLRISAEAKQRLDNKR